MEINIRATYSSLLAQSAAESYLDGVILKIDSANEFSVSELKKRLANGSNHYDHLNKFDEYTKGATQMTDVMLNDFFNQWEVITHYPNTNSGFSATVLRNKQSDKYTLSFRSTEAKDIIDGGDYERDSLGANTGIAREGFAYGQSSDMEEFYTHLKRGESWDAEANNGEGDWVVDPVLIELKNHFLNSGQINITGYSLGGHLAQLFILLHYDDVSLNQMATI